MTILAGETNQWISRLTRHVTKVEKSKEKSPSNTGTASYWLCSYVWNETNQMRENP